MTFSGEHKHNVDEKSRIIMPQRFREALGGNVIITKGLEKCLLAYTMERWKEVLDNLEAQLAYSDDDHREFLRYFLGGAVQCEIDKQGRCLIPPMLREHAGIGNDVVIVGMLDKIEIWDGTAYMKWSGQFEPGKQAKEDERNIKDITKKIGFIKI